MKFRELPPVCLFISILKLTVGKLRFSGRYLNKDFEMEDGNRYSTFRHITVPLVKETTSGPIFIVRFKFSRLSHEANKITSIIPMLMISGFPGFISKIYSVNKKNGYWQGIYRWRSRKDLERYKKSFVFRTMIKRTQEGSLTIFEYKDTKLEEILQS
jgi:hypothetical protein